jgi:peroxiredoxin
MSARVLGVVISVLAVVGLLGYGLLSKGGAAINLGDPAPDKELPTLDGTGTGKISDYRGRWVLVNFWASWCAPCRAEAAELNAVARNTSDRASFIGIDVRDERDKATAFLAGHDSAYPSLFDPAGRVVLGFTDVPPNTTPATLVIDRQGRIAAVYRRAVLREELEPVVRQIAAEK